MIKTTAICPSISAYRHPSALCRGWLSRVYPCQHWLLEQRRSSLGSLPAAHSRFSCSSSTFLPFRFSQLRVSPRFSAVEWQVTKFCSWASLPLELPLFPSSRGWEAGQLAGLALLFPVGSEACLVPLVRLPMPASLSSQYGHEELSRGIRVMAVYSRFS